MFCIHKYTKWQTVSKQNILHATLKSVIGIAYIQERTCTKCGKVKVRVEKDILP